MSDREAVEMMERTAIEIRNLRSTIDRLAPKADAYDHLCKVLDLLPSPSQGYGEDWARVLDKRVAEVKAALAQPEFIEVP